MAKQPKLAGNMKPVIKVTKEVAYTPNRPKPAMGFPTTPERDSTSMPRLMMKSTSAPRKREGMRESMREGAEEAASTMADRRPVMRLKSVLTKVPKKG